MSFVTGEVEGGKESFVFNGLRGADQVQERCPSPHRVVREKPPERSSQATPWWSKRDLSIQTGFQTTASSFM